MPVHRDVPLPDGRSIRVHATDQPSATGAPTLLWHHGSPQTGRLLAPVVDAAAARGIRVVAYARPGYGGSTVQPGRTVADAASDAGAILDALGIAQVVTMGASGGAPHALACAALLPGRVLAAVSIAGTSPFTGDDAWFAGMQAPGGLRAALAGREARARFAETDEFDPAQFIAADWAALGGTWGPLGADAQAAEREGPDGLIDDDVAFAHPWGFDPASIGVPVLLVQGGEDRVVPPLHAERLFARIPTAELWLRPRDGHVSVLGAVPVGMDWLREIAA